MTGQDPMSSTAEGDVDLGTAALADAGTADAGSEGDDAAEATPAPGPPPEAFHDTPVTDAVPEENLGFPEA